MCSCEQFKYTTGKKILDLLFNYFDNIALKWHQNNAQIQTKNINRA